MRAHPSRALPLRCSKDDKRVGTEQPLGPVQQVQVPVPLPLQQPDALLLQLLPNAIEGASTVI